MNACVPDYELRSALAIDHDAIASVWHSSASLPGVGPFEMPTLADMRNRVDIEVANGWVVTVAVRSAKVIGFIAVKPRERTLAELFVRPEELGGGIGKALLTQAIEKMPAGFTLYTRATNIRAQQFYEKAGLVFLRDDVHPRSGDQVAYYEWNAGLTERS